MHLNRQISILLVEDDDIDAEAVKRGLDQARIANPVTRVRNGKEALEALRGSTDEAALPPPHLVLLDLNMPVMNGIEFLENLRADPSLSRTVVMVLTTSNADQDRLAAFDNHVAAYILKARAGAEFGAAIQLVNHYWRYVELPDG